MNFTWDDTSPQLIYTGQWTGSHSDDPQPWQSQTFHSTYKSTVAVSDQVKLTFNGTAVYVIGAKRPNHGTYRVVLDGNDPQVFSGFSATHQFQQTLFAAIDLADVTHTIVIQNLGAQGQSSSTATTLDIDAVVVTEAVPPGQTLKSNVIDDASLQYSGLGWTTEFGAQLTYFSKTGHLSPTNGDSMTFKWNGTGITLVGAVNFNHGPFDVQLDGVLYNNLQGFYDYIQPGAVLFHAGGLANGSHTVTLTNREVAEPLIDLDLDYVQYYWTEGAGGAIDSSTQAQEAAQATSRTNAGAIGGAVAAGIVVVALIGLIVWLLRRRRESIEEEERRYREDMNRPDLISPEEEHKYVTPFTSQGPNLYAAYSGYQDRPDEATWGPGPISIQPPSSTTSSTDRERDRRIEGFREDPTRNMRAAANTGTSESSYQANLMLSDGSVRALRLAAGYPPQRSDQWSGSARPDRTASLPRTVSDYESPTESSPSATIGHTPQRKGMDIALPSTSVPPTSAGGLTPEELRGLRMRVDGRAQDWGPVGSIPEEDAPPLTAALPPDYFQAIEPLPGQDGRHAATN